MTTTRELIARLRAVKTMHAETLPSDTALREMWKAERQVLEQLERSLLERLNAQREVRA